MIYGATYKAQFNVDDVAWVCLECAHMYGGKQPMDHLATYHEGVCDVCDRIKTVTEPRDFVWR
jgi:hypothetical protein